MSGTGDEICVHGDELSRLADEMSKVIKSVGISRSDDLVSR